MDILIAVAHIAGSLLALSVLGIGWWLVAAWEARRNARIQIESAAMELGVSAEDEVSEDDQRRLRVWLASRYSSELLRNRLSDLCGLVRTCWEAIGVLSIISITCIVIWRTLFHGTAEAIYAWLVIPAWLFFIATTVTFSLLCKLLTGRYPGQAKSARKTFAKDLWGLT